MKLQTITLDLTFGPSGVGVVVVVGLGEAVHEDDGGAVFGGDGEDGGVFGGG